VKLCRQSGIELVVALSPIHPLNPGHDDPRVATMIEQLSRLLPVWDFTRQPEVTDRPAIWVDQSHYRSNVALLMIKKIFNEQMPDGWEDFGQLRRRP